MTDLERSASAGDGHTDLDVAHPESQYPVADPGHPEHLPRLTDVDEKAADRATRQVATMFALVPVLAIGFAVAYFAVPRTMPSSTSASCTSAYSTSCWAPPPASRSC